MNYKFAMNLDMLCCTGCYGIFFFDEIDTKTFLKANNILEKAPTAGIPKKHKQEQLPLKIFVKGIVTSCPGYDHLWRYFVSFTE